MQKSKMTIGDFKRYCDTNAPQHIVFCSDNQIWNRVECPVKFSLAFSQIYTELAPNAIYLKDGDNCLWLNKVKYFLVWQEPSPLGMVVDVVCGDRKSNEQDTRYTLIIS